MSKILNRLEGFPLLVHRAQTGNSKQKIDLLRQYVGLDSKSTARQYAHFLNTSNMKRTTHAPTTPDAPTTSNTQPNKIRNFPSLAGLYNTVYNYLFKGAR